MRSHPGILVAPLPLDSTSAPKISERDRRAAIRTTLIPIPPGTAVQGALMSTVNLHAPRFQPIGAGRTSSSITELSVLASRTGIRIDEIGERRFRHADDGRQQQLAKISG